MFDSSIQLGIIFPTEELIFFERGIGIPPTIDDPSLHHLQESSQAKGEPYPI